MAPGPCPLASEGTGLPDAAAALAGGRVLFPVLTLRLSWSQAALTAPGGGRIQLRCEALRAAVPPFGPKARPTREILLTAQLSEGDTEEADYLAVYLRDRLGLTSTSLDACGLALEALGRPEPGGCAPEVNRVRPEDPVALAARKVLAGQALKMRANTEGTLLDLDPEYLHDLRVATRRSRSALKLLGPALGPKRAESLRLELGWLAGLLGEVRDMDVFIAGLRGQSGRLGEAARVALALEAELWVRRGPAREALVSALEGKRFANLLARLQALAGSRPPQRPRGLSGQRAEAAGPLFLRQAYRRVVKQGRVSVPVPGASPDAVSTPAALHRLRILFKRLRYACEFFAPAIGKRLDPLLEAMAKFQDCLGEHQDAVVAAARVDLLAREMAARGDLPLQALLDLGGLIQVQREIASERRARLAGLWKKFDRGSVRRALGPGAGTKEERGMKPSPSTRRRGTA
jgi:CHAD domain-containing protein